MSQDDLWLKIGNKCLSQAIAVLDHSVTPTEEMANLVQTLVSVAIRRGDSNKCLLNQKTRHPSENKFYRF